MKRSKYLIYIPIIFSLELSAALRDSSLISLKDLEDSLLMNSVELKSKQHESLAALEKRNSVSSNYLPKLLLEANYKHITEVSEINVSPTRTIKFGDNQNYSIGPTLSMTLFDFDSKSHLQKSLDKSIEAKENEKTLLRANLLNFTRLHYLNLVFLLEKSDLLIESIKLSKKQLGDVSERNRFGNTSKLDLLSAQKEVHELETQEKEIENQIFVELSEIYKISSNQ